MCERIVIPGRDEVEQELSVHKSWWTFSTRFNVAPSHSVPAARLHDQQLEGVMLRWGLVPGNTRGEPAPGFPTVRTAAVDTTEEFRHAWLHGRRCIVPLAGFYIWQRTPAGHRQPFYARLVNRPVFGVAGIWDRFETDDDDVIEGCALIAVPANTLLAGIAGRAAQMPAILQRQHYQQWLECTPAVALGMLKPCASERMVTHAVGPHVNFLQYDGPQLIRPIA